MFAYIVCSIWPIDRTLSVAPNLGQIEPETNGNERVLYIPQITKAWALLFDGLMSHPGHSLGESYSSWCILQPFFICIYIVSNASSCLLQAMQQGFGLWEVSHYLSVIVSVWYYLLFIFYLMWTHFLLLDLLIFIVCNLSRLWTDMVQIYLLEKLQWQCQRSQCHH